MKWAKSGVTQPQCQRNRDVAVSTTRYSPPPQRHARANSLRGLPASRSTAISTNQAAPTTVTAELRVVLRLEVPHPIVIRHLRRIAPRIGLRTTGPSGIHSCP